MRSRRGSLEPVRRRADGARGLGLGGNGGRHFLGRMRFPSGPAYFLGRGHLAAVGTCVGKIGFGGRLPARQFGLAAWRCFAFLGRVVGRLFVAGVRLGAAVLGDSFTVALAIALATATAAAATATPAASATLARALAFVATARLARLMLLAFAIGIVVVDFLDAALIMGVGRLVVAADILDVAAGTAIVVGKTAVAVLAIASATATPAATAAT